MISTLPGLKVSGQIFTSNGKMAKGNVSEDMKHLGPRVSSASERSTSCRSTHGNAFYSEPRSPQALVTVGRVFSYSNRMHSSVVDPEFLLTA